MMEHRSGKTNPADPLSQRLDFEKGVETDNKQEILLPEHLFPNSSSNQTDEPLINDAAAVCTLDSMETRIEKVQYKTLIFFNGENDMLDSPIPCLIFQLQRTFALEKGVML